MTKKDNCDIFNLVRIHFKKELVMMMTARKLIFLIFSISLASSASFTEKISPKINPTICRDIKKPSTDWVFRDRVITKIDKKHCLMTMYNNSYTLTAIFNKKDIFIEDMLFIAPSRRFRNKGMYHFIYRDIPYFICRIRTLNNDVCAFRVSKRPENAIIIQVKGEDTPYDLSNIYIVKPKIITHPLKGGIKILAMSIDDNGYLYIVENSATNIGSGFYDDSGALYLAMEGGAIMVEDEVKFVSICRQLNK